MHQEVVNQRTTMKNVEQGWKNVCDNVVTQHKLKPSKSMHQEVNNDNERKADAEHEEEPVHKHSTLPFEPSASSASPLSLG